MVADPADPMERVLDIWSDVIHGRFVYAGGAIDYADRERTHKWRHDLAKMTMPTPVYCPICANQDEADDETIMRRNTTALATAARAVFLLDGTYTVGTPVEIGQRVAYLPPETVAIVHPGPPGVFVRVWQKNGVFVVPTFEELEPWLRSR